MTVGIFWEVNGHIHSQQGFTILSDINSVNMVGDFEIVLASDSPNLVSTATLTTNISPSHNGTVLTCLNSHDEMANIIIIVEGNVTQLMHP